MIKNKSFYLLLISSMISDLANWIYRITVLTYVVETYKSASSSLFVSFLMVLPPVLFGYIAGKVADTYSKKTIMVICDAFRIVWMFLIYKYTSIGILFVLLISTAATFCDVCEDGILPELVKKDVLSKANSIYAFFSSVIMIAGPILGGLVATYFSKQQILIIMLVLLFLALLARLLICETKKENTETVESQNLEKLSKNFFSSISSHRKLVNILISTGMVSFAGGVLNALLILFVYQVLGKNATDYGWMLSVKGVAMSIASMFLAKWITRLDCDRLFVLSAIGMGIALVLFPLNKIWVLAIGLQCINAIFNIGYSVSKKTIIQQSCHRDVLGRYFGFLMIVANSSSILSFLIFGSISDRIGIITSLVIGGIIVLCSGILSGFMFRKEI